MKTMLRMSLVAALLAPMSGAYALQPVEAGLQPLHAQIREVQSQIDLLAGEFSSDVAMRAKRVQLGRQLVELIAKRKALEAEVRLGKDLAGSPLVTFMTSPAAAR